MQRQMLKSKIHRATVTGCDVDYVGSITLDPELMAQADLLVNEGDKVIVASFGAYDEADLEAYAPLVVHVDDANEIARVDSHPEVLLDSPLASGANLGGRS